MKYKAKSNGLREQMYKHYTSCFLTFLLYGITQDRIDNDKEPLRSEDPLLLYVEDTSVEA